MVLETRGRSRPAHSPSLKDSSFLGMIVDLKRKESESTYQNVISR